MKNTVNKEQFQLALAMVGLTVDSYGVDLILSLQEGLGEKGDAFSLKDAAKIKAIIERKYNRDTPRQQERAMLTNESYINMMAAFTAEHWDNKTGRPAYEVFMKDKFKVNPNSYILVLFKFITVYFPELKKAKFDYSSWLKKKKYLI